MKRKLMAALVLLLLWPLFTGCGARVRDLEQVNPETRIVLKFSHVVAETSPKGLAAQRFAHLVNERTQDRVEVQVYPNSTLYKDGEEMDALLENNVQMIAPATAKLVPLFPQWQLFDLPYLFQSYDHVHRVMDGAAGRELMNLVETQGFKALAMWDNGFKVMSADRPLKRLEDFRGLRFRVMPSEVLISQFRRLGAETVVLPFSDVYGALEEGRVDGAENPPANLYSKNFHQVQPYVTETNHGYLGYVVLVNADFWAELPADLRQIIEGTLEEVTAWERELAQKVNQEDLQKLRAAQGVEVITLEPAEEARLKQALEPVTEEFAPIIGRDLIEKVRREGELLEQP